MVEEEVWGLLDEEKFNKLLNEFSLSFGKPKRSRRLAFSFWDHKRSNIDTRIRITDGKAEIMQKVGIWEMSRKWSRNEQRINLLSDVEEIFNAYQIIRVLVPDEGSCYIAQFDNYTFKQSEFEIKLTHQTGKTNKYNFEVEADTSKKDLYLLLQDLGLSEMVTITDTEFWDKWNEELNLKDTDLEENEIRRMISQYLL